MMSLDLNVGKRHEEEKKDTTVDFWDWRDNTVGQALALVEVNQDSIQASHTVSQSCQQ